MTALLIVFAGTPVLYETVSRIPFLRCLVLGIRRKPDIGKCALLASVYGVTIDSLVHAVRTDDNKIIPPPPKGKHIFVTVTISDGGQIVIPKQARSLFGIKGGDRLVVLADEEEGLALVKEKAFTDRISLAMQQASDEKQVRNGN